jgi:hypothetical protein
MSTRGVHLETIQPPQRYSDAQLDRACRIACALDRGRLILCEEPKR